eukprot:gene33256-44520_t
MPQNEHQQEEDLEDIVTLVQDGDVEAIKSLPQSLIREYIGINARDKEGCSLMHWAAINNRYEIATFLIDNNLEANGTASSILSTPIRGATSITQQGSSSSDRGLCGGGGVLLESPLQWAIRKRYYAMAELLVTKARADLAHQSAQGTDALHLACKLGDINAVFLLLNWGADPNSVDRAGDSPLLWLVRTCCES